MTTMMMQEGVNQECWDAYRRYKVAALAGTAPDADALRLLASLGNRDPDPAADAAGYRRVQELERTIQSDEAIQRDQSIPLAEIGAALRANQAIRDEVARLKVRHALMFK